MHSAPVLPSRQQAQQGFSLVLALSLVALMSVMLITYSLITVNNARTSGATSRGSAGFYAAEAALNARADRIRSLFKGFQTPLGDSPTSSTPCVGSDQGSDDLRCEETTVAGRRVVSYVWRSGNPYPITVAAGERFAGLVGEETPFTVRSQALNAAGNPEAIASMTFRSRVIPLFQFAVFFDKDMEFDNTARLDFSGPIHSNGNIYLDSGQGSGTSLTLRGQVTSAYDIYRRQKRDNICQGLVQIAARNNNLVPLPCSSTLDTPYANSYYRSTFGGTVESNIGRLDVPSIAALQPTASAEYWRKADVRVVLKRTDGLSGNTWQPQFINAAGQTLTLPGCVDATANPVPAAASAVSYSTTFRDTREARYWDPAALGNNTARSSKVLLDVDVPKLLTCIQLNSGLLGVSGGLQNTSEGGLVIYMTFDDRGPAGSTVASSLLSIPLTNGGNGAIAQSNPPVPNNYGVRLRNSTNNFSNDGLIRAVDGSRPRGVTFVTDQAAFIQGNFNKADQDSSDWIPTAILADSMNVLSNNWNTPTDPNGEYMSAREIGKGIAGYISRWGIYRTGTTWSTPLDCNLPITVATTDSLFYDTITIRNGAGSTRYCLYSDASMNARFPTTGTGAIVRPTGYANAAQAASPLALPVQGDDKSQLDLPARLASDTTINAAILAGTATTGQERAIYSSVPASQSGGVHNMMRFHEEWGGNGGYTTQNYNYRGSLVSLDKPQHVNGSFQVGSPTYNPPLRNWAFETNFRQVAKLPPLTPRFVYIKQENFTRNFSQQ